MGETRTNPTTPDQGSGTRPTCRASVPYANGWKFAPCGHPAKFDPDPGGVMTRCGIHSAATCALRAKRSQERFDLGLARRRAPQIEIERLRATLARYEVALRPFATHRSIEGDCWFSCPKAEDYCGEGPRDVCTCGADDVQRALSSGGSGEAKGREA